MTGYDSPSLRQLQIPSYCIAW